MTDLVNREVMRIFKPFRCGGICNSCSPEEIEIIAGGQLVARVVEETTFNLTQFKITTETEKVSCELKVLFLRVASVAMMFLT